MRKSSFGFTLIELLVVIAILLILGAVVFLVINPFEYQKRGRDATRITDLSNLQTAINFAVQDASASSVSPLCAGGTTPPCSSTSTMGSSNRSIDGTGWVKVDLSSQKKARVIILPIDPINDGTYNYRYYSDGTNWEMDAALESQQFQGKAATDGGNCDTRFEVGTNLAIQAC